jgi:hypothetical protein
MHVPEGGILGIGALHATTYSRFPPSKPAVRQSSDMGPACRSFIEPSS